MALRVMHCPVNFAGIPWQNVLALRRKGVDARLLVFNRELRHPEADLSLDRPRRLREAAAHAMARARAPAAAHRRLPLLLRPDARAEVAAVPDPPRDAEEVRLPLPRLGHPRQDAGRARLRQARRRADRRLVRRAALGARGGDDPARPRPEPVHAGPADRPRAPARRPRAVGPQEEGHGVRDRRVRAAPGRPRHRRGPPARARRASATRARTSSSTS